MPVWPAPERTNPPTVIDERGSLESWLDYHRTTLLLKCAGLAPDQLVMQSCPPSNLSLLGLVRHMADVEAWLHDFDREPRDSYFGDEPDREVHFDDVDPTRADVDLATFLMAVERSRKAVSGVPLDALSPDDSDGPYSLRWIYQHMIEEYARHNGHADLLRERIDGSVGD